MSESVYNSPKDVFAVRLALVVFVVLSLSGCAQPPADSPASQDPAPQRPAPLILEAGTPFVLASKNVTGNVAVEFAIGPGEGSCTFESRATFLEHQDRPAMLRTVDRAPIWSYSPATGSVQAAGNAPSDALPGTPTEYGYNPRTESVGDGLLVRVWFNDVAFTESSRSFGSALYHSVVCDHDASLEVRGSRQALLLGAADFWSLASLDVGLVGSYVVDGTYTAVFDAPADWMAFFGQGQLTVHAQAVDHSYTEAPDAGGPQLPAGPARFDLNLTSNVANFFLAAAAFHPIESASDLEGLPV